jgi:hypothetical protein
MNFHLRLAFAAIAAVAVPASALTQAGSAGGRLAMTRNLLPVLAPNHGRSNHRPKKAALPIVL